MKIAICTTCQYRIPFTLAQIDALRTLSEHHYDVKCKMARSEGGFLDRWRRMLSDALDCGIEDAAVWGDTNDLQICLKLLEMRHIAAVSGLVDGALCDAINRDLWGAVHLAMSKYQDWQATYVGLE